MAGGWIWWVGRGSGRGYTKQESQQVVGVCTKGVREARGGRETPGCVTANSIPVCELSFNRIPHVQPRMCWQNTTKQKGVYKA